MVGKRFISFGCSFTGYVTATWADYIGSNFEEYYNFGQGGASNVFIMNRFIEIDNLLKFNKDDYIVVMFTNMDRFSYRNEKDWVHGGNVYANEKIPSDFIKKMWSSEWSVYQSWISIMTVKRILNLKNIKHKILTSMDNTHLFNYVKDNDNVISYLNDSIDLLDIKQSMSWWARDNYKKEEFNKYKNMTEIDTHPTQKMHYDYVKTYFPEFDTNETKDRYELSETAVDDRSLEHQFQKFAEIIQRPYNKSFLLNELIFL